MTAGPPAPTSRSEHGAAAHAAGRALLASGFDELRVGAELVTGARTLTEADVVGFAALTGDWHRQHTDADWARDSMFGERIAHGLLVLSCAMGLLPIDSDRIVALRRIADATFKAPVRLGDTIHVVAAVAELRVVDTSVGLVTLRWRVVDQHGATAIRARVEVLWRRGA
jgi:3-hydroxybutyryl-CoA dehydratase